MGAMIRLAALAGAALLLLSCQTTQQAAHLETCEALLRGALSAEDIRADYDDRIMLDALQCAAEEGDPTARGLLAEALILGKDPNGSFYQGLFWLTLAEQDGPFSLSDDGLKKTTLFRESLTQPDRNDLQADIDNWTQARQIPTAAPGDKLVTFFVNNKNDFAGPLYEDMMRAKDYRLDLMESLSAINKKLSTKEEKRILGKLRKIATDERNAIAQFVLGSNNFEENFKTKIPDSEARAFLAASFYSFSEEDNFSTDVYHDFTDALVDGDKDALSSILAKESLSPHFKEFAAGMGYCYRAIDTDNCQSKGKDLLIKSSEAGNDLAAFIASSVASSFKDLDPLTLRALRASLSGDTKGGDFEKF